MTLVEGEVFRTADAGLNCEGWREGRGGGGLTTEGLIVESEVEGPEVLVLDLNNSEGVDLVGMTWTGIEGVEGKEPIEGEGIGGIVGLVEEERAWDDGGEVFNDEF